MKCQYTWAVYFNSNTHLQTLSKAIYIFLKVLWSWLFNIFTLLHLHNQQDISSYNSTVRPSVRPFNQSINQSFIHSISLMRTTTWNTSLIVKASSLMAQKYCCYIIIVLLIISIIIIVIFIIIIIIFIIIIICIIIIIQLPPFWTIQFPAMSPTDWARSGHVHQARRASKRCHVMATHCRWDIAMPKLVTMP